MANQLSYSPQAWGCTAWRHGVGSTISLFPTSVGMYRQAAVAAQTQLYLFPTSVGMYRPRRSGITVIAAIPHKRGDVPCSTCSNKRCNHYSPQAWGCTEIASDGGKGYHLFPPSGDVPWSFFSNHWTHYYSPRRGDVPDSRQALILLVSCSPHKWG